MERREDLLTISTIKKCGFGEITKEEMLKAHGIDSMFFWFVREDSVTKYGLDQIVADWNFNARYILSVEEMKLLNYTIAFPPTAAMDSMDVVVW